MENLRTKQENELKQIEGEMFRKAPEGKLKRYWFCLLGKELYCYRKQDEDKHKGMHSLIGVYVLEEEEEKLENGVILYPFKLIFPNNKARTYYLLNQQERNQWVKVIKDAIGYKDINEFYDVGEDIGKGKFGQVKKAIHKKTQQLVAIKVIRKKDMKQKELELQKREIEVLKLSQHPNIIRLVDIFENPEYIFIILEFLAGGDLF